MMPLLSRLMGMETEYAIRLPRNSTLVSHRDAFLAITRSLRRKIPTADADAKQSGKPGVFLATGGAVWMESVRPATNFCFIEGASPECRSPRELLACQRAQDRLLESCAAEHGVTLLKNCCDHRGKTYGAQESYEVKFSSGIMLWIWRLATVMLFLPLCLAVQVSAVLAILMWIVCLPVTALVFVVRAIGKPKREVQEQFDYWIGRVIRTGWDGVELPSSGFFSGPILRVLLIAIAPLALLIWLLVECTQLGKLQRQLAPFLATRIIFTGAGRIDEAGNFCLAEKVGKCRRVSTIVEYGHGFFSLGQFLKPVLTIIRLPELFASQQRLQITLSDANMCEEAEYLRIGTTLLVIEALEAGEKLGVPRLKKVVADLKRVNSDPSLQLRLRLNNGEQLTTIEVQRRYLDVCRRYLSRLSEIPEEVQDIMYRWESTLDDLQSSPESLVGRVDWVTKQFLINSASTKTSPLSRKKIDLRYHELSQEGYFRRFETTGLHHRVIEEEDVARATRLPPMNTPAHARARYIREFSGAGCGVGWKTGRGGHWETR